MPGVELSTRAHAGHVGVALRGDLDVTSAAPDFIDCNSLSALLRVQRLVRSTGGDVVLAAPPRQALRFPSLTGKDDAFGLHASAEDAVVSRGSRRTRYGGRGLALNTARPGRAAPSDTCAG